MVTVFGSIRRPLNFLSRRFSSQDAGPLSIRDVSSATIDDALHRRLNFAQFAGCASFFVEETSMSEDIDIDIVIMRIHNK